MINNYVNHHFLHQMTLFITKTVQGEKLNLTFFIHIFPLNIWLLVLTTIAAVTGRDFTVNTILLVHVLNPIMILTN